MNVITYNQDGEVLTDVHYDDRSEGCDAYDAEVVKIDGLTEAGPEDAVKVISNGDGSNRVHSRKVPTADPTVKETVSAKVAEVAAKVEEKAPVKKA